MVKKVLEDRTADLSGKLIESDSPNKQTLVAT
jgi:hypothetical protein